MSLRINTNVAALTAYNNLNNNQSMQAKAIQELSSGLRINTAADDASGLSISQGLTSQINGLTQAVANANDGINVAQIADGALATTQSVLQRMRTLAVKAENAGTNDSGSLTAINAELKSLSTELDSISTQTKFGSQNLLDGKYGGTFQVGANAGETIALSLTTANLASGASTSGASWNTQATSSGASVGVVASGSVGTVSLASGFNAGSLGVDFNKGDNNTTFSFTGASGTSGASIKFASATSTGTQLDVTVQWSGTSATGTAASAGGYDGAMVALSAINNAISAVSSARSTIGATQNQLNYTVTNLQTSITNVTSSRSNITDADLATEVSAMTQAQILTSAATSVLAQANSMPQAILKLLQ